MNKDLLSNWGKKSAERQKVYKQYLQKARKNDVLKQLPGLHEEAFSKIADSLAALALRGLPPASGATGAGLN